VEGKHPMAKNIAKSIKAALTRKSPKISELESTAELYLNENIILQKELDSLKKRFSLQAAEVLVFVDKVKIEKAESEAYLLKLETELNHIWGFVQELKEISGEDMAVQSLLSQYALNDKEMPTGYVN
jgi:regulator of replication initiation timing